jgi:hypothetical protein
MAVNQTKLDEFMGNFVPDLGAVMHAATIVVGDQLGRRPAPGKWGLAWAPRQARPACGKS